MNCISCGAPTPNAFQCDGCAEQSRRELGKESSRQERELSFVRKKYLQIGFSPGYVAIIDLCFGWRILVGRECDLWGYDDFWDYDDWETVNRAFDEFAKGPGVNWSSDMEPDGWVRHLPSNRRRRPDGQVYVDESV